MIPGILFKENFILNPNDYFNLLNAKINWDTRMKARKTASFGVAYNYSQISYPFLEMPPEINTFCESIENEIGFLPNNCLINLYENGKSKMGFHSDQTDILEKGTGVAIISFGDTRTLRFRNIENRNLKIDYPLPSGSLIYMNQAIQNVWQHAIPKSNAELPRMSLTFRKIKYYSSVSK